MPSAASRAFLSALDRSLSSSPVEAVSAFETLLKAKKAKGDASPVASESAPAPVRNVAPERLGRGTGVKDTSFEYTRPHLVHGGQYQILKNPGTKTETVIGPSHREWDHSGKTKTYTVHNPFEPLARKGHDLLQKYGESILKTPDIEHPNHPYHLAYVANQIHNTLNPLSTRNVATRNRKTGRIGKQEQHENMASAIWASDNKTTEATGLPRNLDEDIHRVTHGVVQSRGTKDKTKYQTNWVKKIVRSALYVAGMNRMLHAARQLGDKFHTMSGEEFTNHVHDNHDLADFSQARLVPGFLNEHLDSAHSYKTHAHADYDKKGKFTGKPLEYFRRVKDAATSHLFRGVEHYGQLVDALKKLPRGSRAPQEPYAADHENLKRHYPGVPVLHLNPAEHYLSGEAHDALRPHTRVFGNG